jgi:pyruvate-formate lyase-activating enzyme
MAMNAAPNAVPRLGDSGLLLRFLALSQAEAPAYRQIMRGQSVDLHPAAPEAFARNFISRQFRGPAAPLAGQEIAVAQALPDAAAADALALVVGALMAIEAGLWDTASILAERAFARDQHETFAQRLLLAATERSPTLHLTVDRWLADRFCSSPFTDAEIIGNHDVYTCCAAWLPARIGTLAGKVQATDIWNSTRAAELRRSILEGDFSYCSRLSCPKIAGRSLPRRVDVDDPVHRRAIEARQTKNLPLPRRVLLSYDTSCNLSCPSCRTKLIQKSQAEVAELDRFYGDRVAPLLEGAEAIKITGSGDPFGSRHFRKVISQLTATPAAGTGARLQLHTNGVLFDRRAWEELSLEGHVRSVWVSVDATEADTYAELRRDGDFDRLWKNLEFLGDLRQQGRIGSLRLDFVVQAANYRQMPALVDRAEAIGADGVHFLMLRNWGTFTEQGFIDRAVAQPGHPLHNDLLAVLDDPRLDRPTVDLGNLAPLRRRSARPMSLRDEPSPALPPVLLVLSLPRSGSNLLFDALEGYGQASVLREAFNPIGAYGADQMVVDEFGQLLGRTLLGPTDDRLVRHLRRHPADSLLQLRRMAASRGRKALMLKIFPDHIDDEVLLQNLLPDEQVRPVFLMRSPLDAWISLQKARASWNWTGVDTTDLRPEVDAQDFAIWQDRAETWFAGLAGAVRASGREPTVLSYEADLCAPEASATDRIAGLLDRILPELRGDRPCWSTRPRQDRTTDPFARIANGAELRTWLLSEGRLERALRPCVLPDVRD